MEKDYKIAELLIAYGKLLTERQKKTAELYYECDLSLGEISEMLGVTRQSVNDSLKKTVSALNEYESKLNIIKNRSEIERTLAENGVSEEVVKKITKIIYG